jgi:hypothetical protein
MILFNASHPPAGATTLIVSLGIISRPVDLVAIETAVFILTAQALCINRLSGVPYPVWKLGAPRSRRRFCRRRAKPTTPAPTPPALPVDILKEEAHTPFGCL